MRRTDMNLFAKVMPSVIYKRRILVLMIALGFHLASKESN